MKDNKPAPVITKSAEMETNTFSLSEAMDSPRKPRTSPLMSPKMPVRSLSKSLGGEPGASVVAAGFEVKFKGNKTWTVTTRLDLGPNTQDEARFRDAVADVNWSELEGFSRQVGVSLPPGLHILLPALRGGLIRRWLELVAVERGVNTVLLFLNATDAIRFAPRLNRVFSRAFEEDPRDDHLILG